IGDIDVRREEIALGDEREIVAVRAHGRRRVLLLAQLLSERDDRLARRVRPRAAGDLWQVHGAVGGGPLLREGIVVDAEHADERGVPPYAERRAVHVDDRAIAPLAADVRPERLTVAI